ASAGACPRTAENRWRQSPNWARRRSAMSAGGSGLRLGELATPLLLDVFAGDLLLQPDDAVEQGLGPGGTTRHVHVYGHDLVDALGHRVGVPVRPSAVGAGTE